MSLGSLLNIPLFMQGVETAYCVPYSLRGIAAYFGVEVTRTAMVRACGTHKKSGSSVSTYAKGIKQFGLGFRRLRFNYRNVRRVLDQKLPIAICYMVSDDESHFSTIIDARRDSRGVQFYTLNDTYYGRYEIPAEVLNYLMKRDYFSWARIVMLEKSKGAA